MNAGLSRTDLECSGKWNLERRRDYYNCSPFKQFMSYENLNQKIKLEIEIPAEKLYPKAKNRLDLIRAIRHISGCSLPIAVQCCELIILDDSTT